DKCPRIACHKGPCTQASNGPSPPERPHPPRGDDRMTQLARSYYRVMLGRQSVHAAECLAGGLIGADFGIKEDLSRKLPEEWRQFNAAFIPVFLAGHPDKSRIAAGLACGALWTVAKGIQTGDVVLCPDGTGQYLVGE